LNAIKIYVNKKLRCTAKLDEIGHAYFSVMASNTTGGRSAYVNAKMYGFDLGSRVGETIKWKLPKITAKDTIEVRFATVAKGDRAKREKRELFADNQKESRANREEERRQAKQANAVLAPELAFTRKSQVEQFIGGVASKHKQIVVWLSIALAKKLDFRASEYAETLAKKRFVLAGEKVTVRSVRLIYKKR
jgi:hypothetical protein